MKEPNPTPPPAGPIPPIGLPLKDALQELTGWEALAIQKRFGKSIEELGGVVLMLAIVWAYANRDGRKTSWAAVEALTLREINEAFAEEPAEPEAELGKDEQPE